MNKSDLKKLQEIVNFLKENKIINFKKGDLEITFSQFAFIPELNEPKKTEQNQEVSPKEQEAEIFKTLMDENKNPSRDEKQISENKPDPLLGNYTEEELFR